MMQTVPSLVGTGTAVAAAAAGLVFSQPTDYHSTSTSTPARPTSNKRKTALDREPAQHVRLGTAPHSSRPGTASAVPTTTHEDKAFQALPQQFPLSNTTASAHNSRHPRPLSTQFTPPKGHSRRQSLIRQGDFSATPIAEGSRDSISSNGSWMRRLSIRPLSQHGSPRSSLLPDSPSLTFSYGSAAPILSPAGYIPPPLPPNKLVKRAPSAHANNTTVTRQRSRSRLPALRRPATSHQRSATLQQFHPTDDGSPISAPKYSLDRQLPSRDRLPPQLERLSTPVKEPIGWRSFFHSRTIKVSGRGISGRASDSSPSSRQVPSSKRICVNGDSSKIVYLTQARTITSSGESLEFPRLEGGQVMVDDHTPINTENTTSTPEDTPSKRARRSISMTFSSPGNWITRAGSIRRPKRGSETKGGKRHVSAPMTTNAGAQEDVVMTTDDVGRTHDGPGPGPGPGRRLDELAIAPPQPRKRNSSSPLPPLSRLSSFNIDLSRLGASGAPQQGQGRPNQPSGSSQASSSMLPPRVAHYDGSSTMNSSDLETRGFTSGDDDDTDFKSDTMFDSIRTVGSARNRTIETPLESMFDESPPSTAGHQKAKRLSIQEILGRPWDGDNKIMEEDEGAPTPVRLRHDSEGLQDSPDLAREGRFTFGPGSQHYAVPDRDFGRLSLDDELNDEDWTKDDDDDNALSNHLSPPSKGSSVNSRNISPNLRMALAAISGNRSPEMRDSTSERPLSNLFDYSEPSMHDKYEADGHSPRPKTVHGKQDLDVRGGRAATRKGPTAAHVRSQSVPVVHDAADSSKPSTTKFGTWGLGSKTVSEDWGDDFEFEEAGPVECTGKDSCKSFVVPAPIQASQLSVKAHSGQIRELSLLVNDLKRLCRHGRDMDMLQGPHAALWEEAEGVIALASPDEETMEGIETSSIDIPSNISDRFVDDGFDAASLAKSEDDGFETEAPAPEVRVLKTAVIRERHSPRRRSVFPPDDDIFGGNWPLKEESSPALTPTLTPSGRPKTPENRISLGRRDVSGMVKTVMEAMQHRSMSSISEPYHGSDGKLHFDTGSLKALVKQASDLRDALSDLVRRADPIGNSPARTPRRDRAEARASPAFTQVFNDPGSSPPRRLPHSRSNNSVLSRTSIDASPSAAMGQRMQIMTVN